MALMESSVLGVRSLLDGDAHILAAALMDDFGAQTGGATNPLHVVENNSAAILAASGGAATQVALAALLTELRLKADLTETQPVAAAVDTAAVWTTLISEVRIDDDPVYHNSPALDVDGWAAAWILISIDSTLAPTTLRVLAQFSDDEGTTWWDYEEGLWAALFWEDVDTASGIKKAYLLPCGGIDLMRINVTGAGTDATNFFDVTVKARAYR